MLKNKVIITGKGGSGKSYLADKLQESTGLKLSPTYTTRSKRKNEEAGVEYNFINVKNFKDLIYNNFFITWVHKKWYYGISYSDWNEYNLFILTPDHISKLDKKNRKEALIIYLDIDDNLILERLNKRKKLGCLDDQYRRFYADKKDFKNFKTFDIVLYKKYSLDELKKEIIKHFIYNNLK